MDLKALRANYTPTTIASAQPAAPGGITGLLEGALPIVGGGLGSIIGTLGGPLGIAAGGAIGSSLGEAGREALSGQKLNGGDIALQGALGAIPGLGAGVKVASGAARAGESVLGSLVGRGAADAARVAPEKIAQAATGAGVKVPGATAASKLQGLSTNLLGSKLNVSPNESLQFRALDTVPLLNSKYGMTVEQAAQVHPVITGAEGAATQQMNKALSKIGTVQVGDFGNTIKESLNSPENMVANGTLTERQVKGLNGMVDKVHTNLNGDTQTSPLLTGKGMKPAAILTGEANAQDVFSQAKQLEKEAYAIPADTTNAGKAAERDLKLSMASELKDRLFTHPQAADALTAAKNGVADQLQRLATQSGNQKLAKVAADFRGVKSLPEYRSLQAPFINAKELQDLTANRNLAQSQGVGEIGNPLKALGKLAGDVANVPLGKAAATAANVINKVKQPMVGGSSVLGNLTTPSKLVGAAAKQTLGRVLTNAPLSGGGETPPPNTASPTDLSQLDNLTNTSNNAVSPSQNGSSSFNSANIEKAIIADIAANGGKNVNTLVNLYNVFGSPKSQVSDLTTNQQNELTSSTNALNQLQSYSDQLAQSGGGRGVAGGPLTTLLGKLGLGGDQAAQAQALEANKADTAAALASAITGSTRPAASVIRLINDSMPSVNDAPAVAQQKTQLLAARLRQAMQAQATPLTQIVGGLGQ